MIDEELLIYSGELQNFLLVEGIDDAHVLKNLLRHYGIPHEFRGLPNYDQIPKGLVRINSHEGIVNLLDALEVTLIGSGERRIGIIVDADIDIAARWQSLRDRLIQVGYSAVPQIPLTEGTIVQQEDLPIVGLWLMPDNILPGMLEDFVSFLVPPNDLLWPIAEHTVQQVIQTDRRFLQEHTSKARIHTWLAWQKIPGTPLGQSITAHYLDAAAPHAQQFIRWIRMLFDLEMVST